MTTPAELSKLIEIAEGFGTVPMLLTVDGSGRPRAVAVRLGWLDADSAATTDSTTAAKDADAGPDAAPRRVAVRVGHRSFANARERAEVTLLWPAPPGERFALLADATVRDCVPEAQPAPGGPGHATHKPGGTLTLEIGFAILHQVTESPR
ncbi:MAG: hypothetical protein U0Q15_04820 [Kineosporiaceae bacterium]